MLEMLKRTHNLPKSLKNLRRVSLLTIICTSMLASISEAANYIWDGGLYGDWQNILNWDANFYPGYDTNDVATFNIDGVVVQVLDQITALTALSALNVNANTTLNLNSSAVLETRSLSLSEGKDLTVSGNAGSSFTIAASTLSVPSQSILNITGMGTLNMGNDLAPITINIAQQGRAAFTCRSSQNNSLNAIVNNRGILALGSGSAKYGQWQVNAHAGSLLDIIGEGSKTDATINGGAELHVKDKPVLRNLTFTDQNAILTFSDGDNISNIRSPDVGLRIEKNLTADKGFTLDSSSFKTLGDLPVILVAAESLTIDPEKIICSPDLGQSLRLYVQDNAIYLGQTAAQLDVSDSDGNEIEPEAVKIGDKVYKKINITSPQDLIFTTSTWCREDGTPLEVESQTLYVNDEAKETEPQSAISSTDIKAENILIIEDENSVQGYISFPVSASEMQSNDEFIVTVKATVKTDISSDDLVESEPICVVIGKGLLKGELTASSSDISVNDTVKFNVNWTNKFAKAPAEGSNLRVTWTIDNDTIVSSGDTKQFNWKFTEPGTYTVKASGMLDNDSDLICEVHALIYVAKLPKFDSSAGCDTGFAANFACSTALLLVLLLRREKINKIK